MLSCPLCAKAFKTQSHVNVHMVSHTKEKPYKCPSCSASYGILCNLKKHIKIVHDVAPFIVKKASECPFCDYKCSGKAHLEVHLRKHSAEQPFLCSIPGCSFKTKYANSVSLHIRSVHNEARPYHCPSGGCNYRGKTKHRLKEHLKSHSKGNNFVCTVPGCNYTFKYKKSLKNHALRAHSDEKPFKCSTCDFRTKFLSTLRQHERKHTKITRFSCQAPNCSYDSYYKRRVQLHFDRMHRRKTVLCTAPGCNYRCGSTAALKEHLKKHELPRLKCPAEPCHFITRWKRDLLKHISRRHQDLQSPSPSSLVITPRAYDLEIGEKAEEMDTLRCQVPNCSYQTKFPYNYDRHKRTHNERAKRKYSCTFCSYRFSDLYALNLHIQMHVGEKPYGCSHCKYTTVSSAQLRTHARKLHDIYVTPCGKEKDVRKCRTCNVNVLGYSEFVLHSMSHLHAVVVLERVHVSYL